MGYTKAIAIDPQFVAAYHNRGIIYRRQERDSQAIVDFNRAIELNPQFAEAYVDRGKSRPSGNSGRIDR